MLRGSSRESRGRRRPNKRKGAKVLSYSFTSTEAQNNFGQILSRAKQGDHVVITRHSRPEAVLLSIEEYETLVGQRVVDLSALEREFDEMFERMQRPSHRKAVDRLFEMTSEDLGQAALLTFEDEE